MRVATSFQFTLANADLSKTQEALYSAQRQAGSGKRSDDLLGFSTQVVPLVSARAFAQRAQGYDDMNQLLETRLSTQDIALTRMSDSSSDLRMAVADALASDTAADLMAQVETAFSSITAAMNTTLGGRFVFSGVAETTQPVNIDSLDDLAAAGAVADIFDNASRALTSKISDNTTVNTAPLASDAATSVYESLKRIVDFNASEPFGDTLSDTQQAFLTAEMASLETVLDDVIGVQATNGVAQAQVASARETQGEEVTYFTLIAGDIENVDLAEVASQLTQSQYQFQAVAQAYNVLRETTLLNYL